MNCIKHICEPQKLFLCWQAPNESGGIRHVIAQLCHVKDKYIFQYLADTNDFKLAQALGFTMYPAFRVSGEPYESGVLEAFTGRISPRTRNDFKEYLQSFRIHEGVSISDFALLGYSGAKLPSDGFSIINPLENFCVPSEFLIELVGIRDSAGIDLKIMKVGDAVEFMGEPNNQHDQQTICAVFQGKKVGYINKCQSRAVHKWVNEKNINILANIERMNGTKDSPTIYIFVQLLPR